MCKLCPARRHCWDKGNCQACEFGEAYFKFEKKIERLEKKVKELRTESEEIKKERWLGAKLYCVIEDLGEAFVSEETVTAVGIGKLWVSGCVPPGDDAGAEVPFSEIGKSVFWDREEAEEKAREILREKVDEDGDDEEGGGMMRFFDTLSVLVSAPLMALVETVMYLQREGLWEAFRWRDIFFKGGTLDGTTLFDYRLTLAYAILAFFCVVSRVVCADREDGAE